MFWGGEERREGRVELTFVPTRRGISVNQQSVHIHVVTHTYMCAHMDTHWFDVATEYISSLVGLYVDF